MTQRRKVWLACSIREDERVQITEAQAVRLHERGLCHPGEDAYTLADGVEFHHIEAALGERNARVSS